MRPLNLKQFGLDLVLERLQAGLDDPRVFHRMPFNRAVTFSPNTLELPTEKSSRKPSCLRYEGGDPRKAPVWCAIRCILSCDSPQGSRNAGDPGVMFRWNMYVQVLEEFVAE